MIPVKVGPQTALPDLVPCYRGLLEYHCMNTPGAPPVLLMLAQLKQESEGNPLAVSRTGPVGLYQFAAATWAQYAKPGDDRKDIFQAAGAAVRMMKDLTLWAQRHGIVGEMAYRFALGAYNQGMGNIGKAMEWTATQGADPRDWGNIPHALTPIVGPARVEEVVDYVGRIMTFWAEFENPTETA